MTERHAWLRKALADRGFTAADVARAWKVDDAVPHRFLKIGEPKITVFRLNALCHLLEMTATELLARLSERPLPATELRDVPISIVAGIAGQLGIDVDEMLARLERPKRRATDKTPPQEVEEW
jgi:DNA-binding Xre family transcriptional regulator